MTLSIKDVSNEGAKRVADNFWFVFFAYFLAIAAWTAVSGTDFISSRWRTVAETRKRGQTHLLVVSLPMSYMVVYIYFQAKSGDYKELCATLVAFGFAVLHMVRTVLGLWELHVFKHWAMRSICTMESLGYRPQVLSSEKETSATPGRSSAGVQEQRRDRAHMEADSIIVNDSIVDNRLSEGDVQCYLKVFTPKQQQDVSNAESLLQRILLTLFFAAKNAVCLVGLFWPFVFPTSQLYSKPSCTSFLEPREPEELWLRWATVLMSCVFPNWVADMRRTCSASGRSQDSAYEACRDRFAEEILLSAALHCERHTSNTKSSSFLPFHEWHKFPKLRSGAFCKQEFLKYACSTGSGLPFQVPHRHAVSGTDEDPVYSYVKYDSKLERARDALPANEGAKLKCVGVEDLEWFSIFLSVEDWSIGSAIEDTKQEDIDNVETQHSDPSGIAIENLCNQLGFQCCPKQFSQRLAAPFLKERKKDTLWGNRNVLTLSAHVDNWLALLAGEQLAYMVEQIPSMEEGFMFRSIKDCKGEKQDPVRRAKGVREEIIRLEKQRQMFQLSVVDPEFSYFDQSLTFLGCSMENLRSCLARWVDSNPDEQDRAWEQALDLLKAGADSITGGKLEFLASEDFEACLLEISSLSCWSQRFLRMRLLWELQNHLHNEVSSGALSPNQIEAMLLCILSFPAIRVIASEIEQTTSNRNFCYVNIDDLKPSPFLIENCKLVLRASFGPQKFHIEVFFARPTSESRIAVSVQLCGDDFQGGRQFVWEAWRDAFYGSLEGTRLWQAEHQAANSSISLRQCSHSIGAGICDIDTAQSGIGSTMKLWKGWPPHRETISKFEITTDGLILQRKNVGVIPTRAFIAYKKRSTFIDCPRVEYVPVSYDLAKSQHLTHASLIAHEFLRRDCGHSVDDIASAVGEVASGRYKEHRDLELLLFEIAATKDNDDVALGKAMDMLISENPSREQVERAVELLERYFTSEATITASPRIEASLYKAFQNKNWVQKIKGHYETLMTGTSFDPSAAISYASFCTFASSYRKEVLNEDCVRALVIAVIRTTFSGNVLLTFELTKSLETLMETDKEDLYSLGCAMYSKKIEHVTKILSKTDKFLARNAKQMRRASKFLDETFKDSAEEDNFSLRSNFESELEKAKADAQVRLAHLFELGACGVDASPSRAVELYSQAIDNGNMNAAYNLALTLENGVDGQNGVPADPCRAMKLLTRAMDSGHENALCHVARLYIKGQCVRKNLPYAVELYKKAIDCHGSTLAMTNLAIVLEKGGEGVQVDVPRAVRLYTRAMEEGGNIEAMQTLASLFHEGAEGVPKDCKYAFRLYERVIQEGGDHRAKCHFANLLMNGGDGVPVNLPRAAALYSSAIEEGDNTDAMFNLSVLLRKGDGVSKDFVRATELLQLSIDKDEQADALISLARVLERGAVGVPADPLRAVELYTRAIENHGSGDAMYEMGRLFELGADSLPSDSTRAFSLYSRAASEKNHKRAAQRLAERKEL